MTDDQPVAGDRLEIRQRRQLAGGAVDRVLDVTPAALLLHPSRGQLDQVGEHPLGELRMAANGEADHLPRLARARRREREPPSPPRVRRAQRLVQPLGQLPLLLAQVGGHVDVEHHVLVAARRAAQRWQPHAPQDDVLAGLRPRRDLDLALAVEGRDGHRAAEHRSSGGQLDDRNQLLAVALEALVLGNQHLHVEVPDLPAGLARVPGARDPDPLARLDPRRDLDLPGAHADGPSLASALLAGRLGHLALAAAGGAGAGPHHLTEGDPGHLAQLAAAAARLAGPNRGSGLGAVAAAALAGRDRLDRHLARGSREHLGEAHLDSRRDVAAAHRPGRAEPEQLAEQRVAAPEERGQHILEAAEGVGARRPAAGAQALVAEGVIGAAAVGVGEDLVGLGGLLELLLRLRVVLVDVRVQLARQPAEAPS